MKTLRKDLIDGNFKTLSFFIIIAVLAFDKLTLILFEQGAIKLRSLVVLYLIFLMALSAFCLSNEKQKLKDNIGLIKILSCNWLFICGMSIIPITTFITIKFLSNLKVLPSVTFMLLFILYLLLDKDCKCCKAK